MGVRQKMQTLLFIVSLLISFSTLQLRLYMYSIESSAFGFCSFRGSALSAESSKNSAPTGNVFYILFTDVCSCLLSFAIVTS